LNEELSKLLAEKAKFEEELKVLNQKTSYANDERDRLEARMKENMVDKEIEEKYIKTDSNQIFQNLKKLVKNQKKYTDLDKILFDQLKDFKKKIVKYKHFIGTNESNVDGLHNIIEEANTTVEETNNQIFYTFSEYFEKFFLRIVPNGKAKLKQVYLSQDNGATQMSTRNNRSQTQNGVEVSVQFDKAKGNKMFNDLSQLSPGQRTVVSICII